MHSAQATTTSSAITTIRLTMPSRNIPADSVICNGCLGPVAFCYQVVSDLHR